MVSSSPTEQSTSADPSAAANAELFAGMSSQSLEGPVGGTDSAQGGEATQDQAAKTETSADTSGEPGEVASTLSEPCATAGLAQPDSVLSTADQLTETLKAANPPPGNGPGSDTTTSSDVTTSYSFGYLPGSAESLNFVSPPPALSTVQGLINEKLTSFFPTGSTTPTIPTGGTATFTVSGDYAQSYLVLHGVTLNFTNLAYASGAWSGSVEVQSTSASFQVSEDRTVAIAPGGTLATDQTLKDFAVRQSFTLSGAAFTFAEATQFRLGKVQEPTEIGWPGWLAVETTEMTISWQHLQTNPDDAHITFSAKVLGFRIPEFPGSQVVQTIINTLAIFQGTVGGVTIDVKLLQQDKFPVTDILSFSAQVGVNIPLLGNFQLGLVLGVAKVDATGKVIPESDILAPVADRVFYAAIMGTIVVGDKLLGLATAGDRGGSLRIGFSELGPLQIYLEVFAPVILDPASGLTISDFRGGLTFNSPLPSVTDPNALRGPAFKPVNQLSIGEWTDQLKAAVVHQAQAAHDDSDFTWGNFADLGSSDAALRIEGGASLFFQKIPRPVISADADFILSTNGVFEVVARVNILSVIHFTAHIYGDFSGDGDAAAAMLFLADLPELPGFEPLFSLRGGVIFKGGRADGTPVTETNTADSFIIELVGGLDVRIPTLAPISLTGTIDFIFSGDDVNVQVHSHVEVPGLGAFPMVSGDFTMEDIGGENPTLWGWAALGLNLDFFDDAGISVNGAMLFRINTSSTAHEVTITNLGATEQTLELPANSMSFYLSGGFAFGQGGVEWFSLNGTFDMEITSSSLSVSVPDATLTIGPASAPFLAFHGSAFMTIRTDGVAAKLYMSLSTNFPSSFGVTLSASFGFFFNTTSQDVTLIVPSSISGAGGDTTVLIPRAPPAPGAVVGASWTVPSGTAGVPYLLIQANGSLTVLTNLVLNGKFDLLASPNQITIKTDSTLNIQLAGITFLAFSVTGSVHVDGAGLAGVLHLDISSSVPAAYGFSLSGQWQYEINTTDSTVVVTRPGGDSAFLPAETARVYVSGNFSVSGVITIGGKFELTVNGSGLRLHVDASLSLFNTPSLYLLGNASITSSGIFLELYLAPTRAGDGTSAVDSQVTFGPLTFNGRFQLKIDTQHSIYQIGVTSLNVNVYGFNLTGGLIIGISGGNFSIEIPTSSPLSLNFFGLVTVSVSGYIHSDGSFSLTAGAGITIGTSSFGISGSVSVTFSSSGGFIGSVSGTVTAFNTTLANASGQISISGSQVSVSITLSVLLFPAVDIETPGFTIPAVEVCAPSWLGGGCATITPAIQVPGVSIHTPAVYVSKTATFVLGSTTNAPGPPPSPPSPVLATRLSDGTLQLNIGIDAGLRGASYPAQPTESYIITHAGGSAGHEDVFVSALNFTIRYNDISGIVVHNTQAGSDFIHLAADVVSSVNFTLGSGSNQITTGAGGATINGGTGSNEITAGSGGGTFTGGLGQTTVHDAFGNMRVLEPGFLNYVLSNQTLTYDGNQVNLDGVKLVTLVGGGASNTFNLSGWSYSAALQGQGTTSQLIVNNDVNYTLSDQLLTESNGASINLTNLQNVRLIGGSQANSFTVSGFTGTASLFGGTGTNTVLSSNNSDFTLNNGQLIRSTGGTFNLNSIQAAQLTGGAGNNLFEISQWTGTGALDGQGGTDTVSAENDVNFVLSSSALTFSNGANWTLASVEQATLSGRDSVNSFTVSNWTGSATLDGKAGADTYNVSLIGAGAGSAAISDSGSNGTDTLTVNGPAAGGAISVTAAQVSRGSETVTYSGLETLTVNGGTGNDNFTITGINASTTTTADGAGGTNDASVQFAQNFAGTLNLVHFQTASVQVNGNFNGTLSATSPGLLQQVTIGQSMTGGTLSALQITSMSVGAGVGGNVAGTVQVSTSIGTFTVGGSVSGQITAASITSLIIGQDLSGTVQTSGNLQTLSVGGSITSSGRVLVGGNLTTASVGQNLAGLVQVSGAIGSLTVHGSLTGQVTASNVSTLIKVDQNSSGEIEISGAVQSLQIGGSLSSAGTVAISGNLVSASIGQDLAGQMEVGGMIGSLTVAGSLSGTVTTDSDLELLTVTGNVSGSVSAGHDIDDAAIGQAVSGTIQAENNIGEILIGGVLSGFVFAGVNINSFRDEDDVSGEVTAGGVIDQLNITGSVTETGQITAATINDAGIGGDVAGIVEALGADTIGTMVVDGSVSGLISSAGTIQSLTIGEDLSGTVEAGSEIGALSIGGSVTSSGLVDCGGDLGAIQIGLDLAGNVEVAGNVSTAAIQRNLSGHFDVGVDLELLTVGGNLSGAVAVAGALVELSVAGNISGTVEASGTTAKLTVGGSVTASGSISIGANLTQGEVAGDVSGTLSVGQSIGTLSVAGSVGGLISAGGSISSLGVGQNISGTVKAGTLIDVMTVGGSLTVTGLIQAPTIHQLTVNGDVAGTIKATGTDTIGTLVIHGSVAASGLIDSAGTIHFVSVDHDMAGHIQAVGDIGTILVGTNAIFGSVTGSGVVKGANLATMGVSGDIAGQVLISGLIGSMTVGGSISGTVSAGTNFNTLIVGQNISGTVTIGGTLGQGTIGGSVSGLITAGAMISNLAVGQDISGTVKAGTLIDVMTVGGSLTVSGLIQAPTINLLTINGNVAGTIQATGADTIGTLIIHGSVAPSGLIDSAGTIHFVSVDHDMAGRIQAVGDIGTALVGTSSIVGSVTGTGVVQGASLGTMTVTGDIAGQVLIAGTIGSITVGASISGTVSAGGNFDTLSVGQNISGTVQVGGNLMSASVGGSVSGSVTVQGNAPSLTIGQDISGQTKIFGNAGVVLIGGSVSGLLWIGGNASSISIGHDISGTVQVVLTLNSLALGGTLTDSGHLLAGDLVTATIGGNLAGELNVTRKLGSLTVQGDTSGTITAGEIDTIAVYRGRGPIVARIVEGGITRRIEAALPANPYPAPKDQNTPVNLRFPAEVWFQYFYDSRQSAGLNPPQLGLRVMNPSPNTLRFDLSLVVYGATVQFQLARLDTPSGQSAGLRNVVVEGDLLMNVTGPMADFFGYALNVAGGIRLPADRLAGVSIRDHLFARSVQVRALAGIAFGSTHNRDGLLVNGARAREEDANNLLTPDSLVIQANDTFRVAFADGARVGFFLNTQGKHDHEFKSGRVSFTDQTPNDARGAVTALVTVFLPAVQNGNSIRLEDSIIDSIDLRGDGGAIQTDLQIRRSITSTGPLGDLVLGAQQGLPADVTAPSIIGDIIVSKGPIAGTIQTTGQRLDPISTLTAAIPADFGRVYTHRLPNDLGEDDGKGAIVPATIVSSGGGSGGFTGRLISRGHLISRVSVNAGMNGLIAVQGDFGAQVGTTRVGGLSAGGQLTGRVIVLGNLIGDVLLNGGLKGGRVAIKGGILGNLTLNGSIDPSGALLSGGAIGDVALGTDVKASEVKGILAARGTINLAKGINTKSAAFFKASFGVNNPTAAAFDAIFSHNGQALRFDSTNTFDLQGLSLILNDLNSLRVDAAGALAGTTA